MRIVFALGLILVFSSIGAAYVQGEEFIPSQPGPITDPDVMPGVSDPRAGKTGGLVPCGGPGEDPCTVCHLFQLISNIINFIAFRFAPIVAAFLFVYAGIMMIVSAGNPGKFQAATKMFWSVIIGLAIIYGAWLITNSIIQALAVKNNAATNWYDVDCTSSPTGGSGSSGGGTLPTSGDSSDGGEFSGGGGEFGGGGASGDWGSEEGTSSDDRLTTEEARDQFAENGIPVNKDECPVGVRFQDVPGGCTSVEGIRPEVVEGVTNLRNNCGGCLVRVTGGVELGHGSGEFSHENGYKVDLGRDPQLDSYIMNNYDYIGVRSDGASLYRDSETGAVYAREGNHWDVKGWDANYQG